MKVLVVDDDKLSLDYLVLILNQIDRIKDIYSFTNPNEALDWLKSNKPDVAFLDVQMKEMDGIQLGHELKNIYDTCPIIFVTGFEKYALDAIKLHAEGYILKPAKKEEIEAELDHMFKNASLANENTGLEIRCFGNFEVFKNGVPLKFKHSKSKELLAYLVHRQGATCSVRELGAILFEEIQDINKQQSRLRNLVADLTQVFTEKGVIDALYKAHGCLGIIPQNIKCDLYDYIKKDETAMGSYAGEYMAQYEWGEDFIGYLDGIKKNK